MSDKNLQHKKRKNWHIFSVILVVNFGTLMVMSTITIFFKVEGELLGAIVLTSVPFVNYFLLKAIPEFFLPALKRWANQDWQDRD